VSGSEEKWLPLLPERDGGWSDQEDALKAPRLFRNDTGALSGLP
jgi:hypothetical protein